MIDRAARDRLADLFERYASRTLLDLDPLDAFGAEVAKCRDRVVPEILSGLGGSGEVPIIDIEYMGPKDRIMLLRCASFLRSDLEYEWPAVPLRRPSYTDLIAFFAGCCGVIAWLAIFFWIEWFNGMLAAPFVWLIVAMWTESRFTERARAAQLARHRSEGRDWEAWPYRRLADRPTETLVDSVATAGESA